jgi:hypothetical protein
MNRQEWRAIALALQAARLEIESLWPPRGGYNATGAAVHDQKLIRSARLDGVQRTALAICNVLKSRSSRFDPIRFMAIVNGKADS